MGLGALLALLACAATGRPATAEAARCLMDHHRVDELELAGRGTRIHGCRLPEGLLDRCAAQAFRENGAELEHLPSIRC